MKQFNNLPGQKRGFTLLELLAVVGILSFILIAVTQLLGSTLAGSGKSNSLQLVKQNGQFALSTMARLTRLAKSVGCGAGSELQLVVSEGGADVTYEFELDGGESRLKKSQDGGFSWVWVTEGNVQVDSFSCILTSGSAGNPSVVDLRLTISKPGLSVENSVVNTDFNTSVSLRTY